MALKALLWDVDGTLAETERDGHLKAFNQAFAALEVPWRWSEQHYGVLLQVAGGRERLRHDMQTSGRGPAGSAARDALAERIHRCKNQCYAALVAAGELTLRDGVRELLDDCARADLPLGIVTTTSRTNVEALLQTQLGSHWENRFASVVTAREAPLKKPHPQAYRIALEALGVRPHEAVALEDAPAGVAATATAGIPVLITRSQYFDATQDSRALAAGPSLGQAAGWRPSAVARAARIDLQQIRRWYASSDWARL
jgi:HAD superfamily hydrolase (TIGR01509 family)